MLQVTANVASMAEMCAELKGVKYAKEILKDLQHHVGLLKTDCAQLLEAFKGGGQGGLCQQLPCSWQAIENNTTDLAEINRVNNRNLDGKKLMDKAKRLKDS